MEPKTYYIIQPTGIVEITNSVAQDVLASGHIIYPHKWMAQWALDQGILGDQIVENEWESGR
jgi:hypothetical protein